MPMSLRHTMTDAEIERWKKSLEEESEQRLVDDLIRTALLSVAGPDLSVVIGTVPAIANYINVPRTLMQKHQRRYNICVKYPKGKRARATPKTFKWSL